MSSRVCGRAAVTIAMIFASRGSTWEMYVTLFGSTPRTSRGNLRLGCAAAGGSVLHGRCPSTSGGRRQGSLCSAPVLAPPRPLRGPSGEQQREPRPAGSCAGPAVLDVLKRLDEPVRPGDEDHHRDREQQDECGVEVGAGSAGKHRPGRHCPGPRARAIPTVTRTATTSSTRGKGSGSGVAWPRASLGGRGVSGWCHGAGIPSEHRRSRTARRTSSTTQPRSTRR